MSSLEQCSFRQNSPSDVDIDCASSLHLKSLLTVSGEARITSHMATLYRSSLNLRDT